MNKMGLLLVLTLLLISGQAINQKCNLTPVNKTILDRINPFKAADECPVNAYCLENGYCACNDGFVGGCTQLAYTLQNKIQTHTTVTHEDYIFFKITAETEAYIMLLFTLCHTQGSSNTQMIDVWDDNGSLNVLNKSNALQGSKDWPINDGCIKLNTPFMMFDTQPNGSPEAFIMGIRLTNPGSINITLSVEIQQLDFWDLIMKILFILGACFLLTLIIAVSYIVYKWRRRRSSRDRTGEISHLDEYMPKFKISADNTVAQEVCSVCLLELNETEWLRKTVCGHIFHQDCLDEWCKSNLNCPICRKSFQEAALKQDRETAALSQTGSIRSNLLV